MSTYDNFGQFRGFGGRTRMPMPMSSESSGLQRLLNGVQGFIGNNPLVSGGLNMLTGGLGSLFTTGLNMFTQSWANNRQMDMWNAMNEYNTPDAQIQRFLDAGINPAAAVSAVTGGPNETTEPTMPANPSAAPDMSGLFGDSLSRGYEMKQMSSQIDVNEAQKKDLEASANLKKSQDIGQQIDNMNKQDIIDATLRNMDDQHFLDEQSLGILMNDRALSDILFEGKVNEFFMNLWMLDQDIQNAEAEHRRILADIAKTYSDIEVNAATIGNINADTRYKEKQTAVEDENRRWMAYRRNMVSQFHYDPESSTESNIMMRYTIGDYSGAAQLVNGLGRMNYSVAAGQATGEYYTVGEQRDAYKDFTDCLKFYLGGYGFGAGQAAGSRSVGSGYGQGNMQHGGSPRVHEGRNRSSIPYHQGHAKGPGPYNDPVTGQLVNPLGAGAWTRGRH